VFVNRQLVGVGNIPGEILVDRDGPAGEDLTRDTIETGFLVERQNASVFTGFTEPAPHILQRDADCNRSRWYVSQLVERTIEPDEKDRHVPTCKDLTVECLLAVAQLAKPEIPADGVAKVANVIVLKREFVASHAGAPLCRIRAVVFLMWRTAELDYFNDTLN
jgi:hypothetical protein